MKILLFGSPNVGKSTLFNALCKENQKVGNWSGTTTDFKSSYYSYNNHRVDVIDLPGIYDLFSKNPDLAEKVACKYLLQEKYDLIINVVDITNLQFNLNLTIDLLNLKIPTIVVINMVDKQKKHKVLVNSNKLELLLGTPVLKVSAINNIGIDELKQFIDSKNYPNIADPKIWFNAKVNQDTQQLHNTQSLFDYFYNLKINNHNLFVNAKQTLITSISKEAIYTNKQGISLTEKIDSFLLHKQLGIPFFLVIIYLMFSFAIKIGGVFQSFFDSLGSLLLIDGSLYAMELIGIPFSVASILSCGLGGGLLIVVSFIPVLFAFFIALALLEQSGYMSRIVFLTNRIMKFFGLNGKSLIPILMGFGCTVPSVMSTRIINNDLQRKITMLSSHFLSCGARLSVYIVFCAVFFKSYANLVILFLYIFGFIIALFTSFIFSKIFKFNNNDYFVIDLPKYAIPSIKNILFFAYLKLKSFLTKATKYIIPLVFMLTLLNNKDFFSAISSNITKTPLHYVGEKLTPIFYPMGITENNWAISISILTGLVAKEGAIATLQNLYGLTTNEAKELNIDYFKTQFINSFVVLKEDILNVSSIKIIQNASDEDVSIFSKIIPYFNGIGGVFAYLIFIMMYAPCASVIGAIIKEADAKWAFVSFVWSTILAYICAVICFQLFNLLANPIQSIIYILCAFILFAVSVFSLKKYITL